VLCDEKDQIACVCCVIKRRKPLHIYFLSVLFQIGVGTSYLSVGYMGTSELN
jgi:hypothetical protein